MALVLLYTILYLRIVLHWCNYLSTYICLKSNFLYCLASLAHFDRTIIRCILTAQQSLKFSINSLVFMDLVCQLGLLHKIIISLSTLDPGLCMLYHNFLLYYCLFCCYFLSLCEKLYQHHMQYRSSIFFTLV